MFPENAEYKQSKKTEPEIPVIRSVLSEQQEREKRSLSVINFGLFEASFSTTSNTTKKL